MNEGKVRAAVEIAYSQMEGIFSDEDFEKGFNNLLRPNYPNLFELSKFIHAQCRKEMKELLIRTLRELSD